MDKVICSPCKEEFKDNAGYLAHPCKSAGGAKPTQPEYLKRTTTPNFDIISAKAKERGEVKKAK